MTGQLIIFEGLSGFFIAQILAGREYEGQYADITYERSKVIIIHYLLMLFSTGQQIKSH